MRLRLALCGLVPAFFMSALVSAAAPGADARSHILWRNTSTGENAIWQMNGTSFAASAFIPTVSDSDWRMVGLGDFDGSGTPDILWRNAVTGDNAIWLIEGLAMGDTALVHAVPDPDWKIVATADFNGDGKADILWRNANTGENALWLMNGTSVSSMALIPAVADAEWTVIAARDFDGDGKADVLWRNASTGDTAVWLMNGSTLAGSALLLAIPDPDWKVAAVADFNGDGKADILWRNASTGENGVWLMNGLAVTSTALINGVPDANWTIVGAGDYDRNGKADILWRNGATGENAVWLMDGATVASAAMTMTVADLNWKSASNLPVTPLRVLSTQEAVFVKDNPAVYAVEQNRALEAAVITYDGQYTFADVNADVDDTDAVTPEVAAHFVMEGYPEDGLQTNATLRLRGNISRRSRQKSYRVKLAGSVPAWRGEKTLQFNKHPYDLTRMRNKLAFDLFRDIPHMPSLRTQFVRINITNRDAAGNTYAPASDYGLFTHVEKMGKEYLTNRGLPTNGNIYKAENFAFRYDPRLALDATGKPVDTAQFELVLSLEADNGNHQKLIEMLTALNDPNSNFDAVFDKYFDKNNYLTWLAVNILMGNRDTVSQNFALNQPKGSDKFYFMPWDYDGAFGFEDQPSEAAAGPLYSSVQLSLANWWGIPLHQRFLKDPRRLNELKQVIDEIRDNYLTEAKVKAKVTRYMPIVQPFISRLPDSRRLPAISSTPVAEWAAESLRLAKSITKNRNNFFAALEAPMPYWQAVQGQNGNLRFTWDAAVDLQGDAVAYTAQISSDPDFLTIQDQVSGLGQNTWTTSKPPNGTWYFRVLARDSKGNTQIAFDRFRDASGNHHFGVLGFQVTDTGVVRLN